MLTWLLSKIRTARIVRGLQDEDGWVTWYLVAGDEGEGGEICSAQVVEWSDSLRYRALETFAVAAREMGYHLHSEDLRTFGAGLDLNAPMPRAQGKAQARPAPEEIANADLTEGDLPEPNAPIDTVFVFAVTFNGYAHWGSLAACAEVANRIARDYAAQGVLPQSLTELRTALFFEQRRWHHFSYDPDAEATAYMHTLVEAIRERVRAGATD